MKLNFIVYSPRIFVEVDEAIPSWPRERVRRDQELPKPGQSLAEKGRLIRRARRTDNVLHENKMI